MWSCSFRAILFRIGLVASATQGTGTGPTIFSPSYFFFCFFWRIQSIIYNTWAVAIGCGPCARSYINEVSNFREMLTIIFKALIKNLIKESFYEKKKKINILIAFYIFHKSDIKIFLKLIFKSTC